MPPAITLKKLLVFAECFVLISWLIFNPCRLIRVMQIINCYIRLFGNHRSVDINTKQLSVPETCSVNFRSWESLFLDALNEGIVQIKFKSFDASFRAIFAHLIPEYYVKFHYSFATFSEYNCSYNPSL